MTKRGRARRIRALGKHCSPSSAQVLGTDLYRYQFRAATRVLKRLDGIFSSESAHQQGQFPVGSHLEGSAIDPLHISGAASTPSVHFHNKLDVLHVLCP